MFPGSQGQREAMPMRSDRLPQEAREPRVDVLPGGARTESTLPRRVGAWILHELRGALPPTIFFFVGFNFIILTTNLLVADYAVAISNFMLATVAALVVGKAVITANAMPFLKLFDRAHSTGLVQDRRLLDRDIHCAPDGTLRAFLGH
jgi:hypothetical protein